VKGVHAQLLTAFGALTGSSNIGSLIMDGKELLKSSRILSILAILISGFMVMFGSTPALAGVTTRVSVATNGTQGNAVSFGQSISADGRYVAFMSRSSNLVAGDTNGRDDIFVHDRRTGATTLVSVSSAGTQGSNGSAFSPSISADGRYVAFGSNASDLVAGGTNWMANVFVHDRQTGVTTLVSVSSIGTQGNSASRYPSISADGRYVAFNSDASNLVAGDTNNKGDIFVHDRQTGVTTRVSVDSAGTQATGGNAGGGSPSISSDGRYVAFDSDATNLVAGDTNGHSDVFVHDRQTGATTRVSVNSDGTQGNGSIINTPSISSDGRYVAFVSTASNLVRGDTNGVPDVFVHDRQTGVTRRVSVSSTGSQSNGWSFNQSISADGRYVAFDSDARNLVARKTYWQSDVYAHDRQTGVTTQVSVNSAGIQGNGGAWGPSISADGRYVVFESATSNLVAGDTNGHSDIFVHDRGTPPLAAILVSPSGVITTTTPTYRWNAVAGATVYKLLVRNAAGTTRINANYTSTAVGCPAGKGTCSLTPSAALAVGAHKWWIRAYNPAGWGPFSAAKPFYVATTVPGKAYLYTPSVAITTPTPAYTWNAIPGATKYVLQVNNPGTTLRISLLYTSAQAGCASGTGTCSVIPNTALVNGTGSWYIRAWNPLGYGAWSAGKAFTKQ
jgi:Tol biopolymer transport system component